MAVPTMKAADTSALEKSKARTGKCIVCGCGSFEFLKVMDGFRTCECLHTQHGHAVSFIAAAKLGVEVK